MGFYFCDQDLDGDQSVLLQGPGRRHCLARMSPHAPTGTEWPQWSHGLQLENKCRDNVSVHAKSHWEITQKCHWHITKLREDFVISRVIFQFIFWTILYKLATTSLPLLFTSGQDASACLSGEEHALFFARGESRSSHHPLLPFQHIRLKAA